MANAEDVQSLANSISSGASTAQIGGDEGVLQEAWDDFHAELTRLHQRFTRLVSGRSDAPISPKQAQEVADATEGAEEPVAATESSAEDPAIPEPQTGGEGGAEVPPIEAKTKK